MIQSTISTSLEGHLGRIETTLSGIVRGQSAQASRLTKLERQSTHHQLSLDEMALSHTRRMDNLEAEIVQLQKMTPQSSPVHSLSIRAAGPGEEASFDLVIGGWKEGLSRETIQKEISSLLSSANLATEVNEVRLFGKRPWCNRREVDPQV